MKKTMSKHYLDTTLENLTMALPPLPTAIPLHRANGGGDVLNGKISIKKDGAEKWQLLRPAHPYQAQSLNQKLSGADTHYR